MKWLLPAALFCALPCYAQLPDMPKPKVADKKFWFTLSALGAAKTADAITSIHSINRRCPETNPVFGMHPSDRRVALTNAAFFAGESLMAYSLKRFSVKHRWAKHMWLIYPMAQTGEHIYWAAVNEGSRCQ